MSRLRDEVLTAKERLADGYRRLRERHAAGASGVEVCAAISDVRDAAILELFDSALASLGEEEAEALRPKVALVAHGGYGRREVAPFSDVDLMLLYAPGSARQVRRVAKRMVCDVFDAGLVLGHSVRSPEQACRMACQDAVICTSQVDSRLLTGSRELFDDFFGRFRRRVRNRAATLLAAIEQARLEERMKYGETVFLLEPHVKRSQGGLRDMQLIRWVGLVRYGLVGADELVAEGLLPSEDVEALARAREFLLRLRNEMHFHAGKSGDVLTRPEQLRIAGWLGYKPSAGMLPVEHFMRDYFRHTGRVSHVTGRFVAKARAAKLGAAVEAMFGHVAQGGYRVGPTQIMATRQGLEQMQGSLVGIMQLVDLANLYDRQIAPETWEHVRAEALRLPDEVSPEAWKRFRSLLAHPTRLGELLRALHEVGILEKFLPAFSHARGLLQFNQYHKYTVDEHSFRTVEAATELPSNAGLLGRVYRGLGRKDILHLALLLHDAGKGYPEDHSLKGAEIARDTARRMGLDQREADALEFLVRRHLIMNHLAFRRDTSDERVVVRFSVEVGSPELLGMLFVLTASDLAAVGPGAWNSWKADVLADVYRRAMQHLADESPTWSVEENVGKRREAVRKRLGREADDPWLARQLAAMPAADLFGAPPEQMADDLRLLRGLEGGGVQVRTHYRPDTETIEVTVATSEDVAPGIFHKLTGAISRHGLEILSAQIHTLPGRLVLDRFQVLDPDYQGEPPADRLAAVGRSLEGALTGSAPPPTFRRVWQFHGQQQPTVARIRVEIDNSTSPNFTVLDIFAVDRPGLLYEVTRTLFELELSVWRAKIGTYLDQVVDVFYVTDQHGHKVESETRLQQIRARVLEVILKLGQG